jgi:hypothetical protein
VVLKPLKNAMAPAKSTRIVKGLRQLTAIVAISFQGAVPINAEFMSNWLGNQVPDGVANIKVRAIDTYARLFACWICKVEKFDRSAIGTAKVSYNHLHCMTNLN